MRQLHTASWANGASDSLGKSVVVLAGSSTPPPKSRRAAADFQTAVPESLSLSPLTPEMGSWDPQSPIQVPSSKALPLAHTQSAVAAGRQVRTCASLLPIWSPRGAEAPLPAQKQGCWGPFLCGKGLQQSLCPARVAQATLSFTPTLAAKAFNVSRLHFAVHSPVCYIVQLLECCPLSASTVELLLLAPLLRFAVCPTSLLPSQVTAASHTAPMTARDLCRWPWTLMTSRSQSPRPAGPAARQAARQPSPACPPCTIRTSPSPSGACPCAVLLRRRP